MSTLSLVDRLSVVKGALPISSGAMQAWTTCANLVLGGGALSTLGKRITWARERAGLSREELAAALGYSYSTQCKYEEDARRPNPDTLRQIAETCGVSTDYLLARTDDPDPRPQPESDEVRVLFRNARDLLPEDREELQKFIEWLKERRKKAKGQSDKPSKL